MAFNAAASGWVKRRAPLRESMRLFVEACASSPRACRAGLEWALGFGLDSYGLRLGVLGLVLQGFGLGI